MLVNSIICLEDMKLGRDFMGSFLQVIIVFCHPRLLMSLFTGMEEWPVVKWREMQLNDGIKHWIRET